MTSIHEMNVLTATTAELLAFYNAHSGAAPVKRFADRKSAMDRVSRLVLRLQEAESAAAAAEKEAAAPAVEVTKLPARGRLAKAERAARKIEEAAAAAAAYVAGKCPKCGATSDITCGRVVESRGGQHTVNEHEAYCHSCGHEFHYDTGKPLRSRRAASKPNGAAVAASWADKDVAARRAERTSVEVIAETDAGKVSRSFKSVRMAFLELGLPMGVHIRFRGELKAAGRATIQGFDFIAHTVSPKSK